MTIDSQEEGKSIMLPMNGTQTSGVDPSVPEAEVIEFAVLSRRA
jgi:hypothetical protein